jgi:hypothetical protein
MTEEKFGKLGGDKGGKEPSRGTPLKLKHHSKVVEIAIPINALGTFCGNNKQLPIATEERRIVGP